MPHDWLPDLILMDDHENIWEQFLEAVYAKFVEDFLHSKPAYPEKRFALKRHPVEQGKEATFWHLVSTGKTEADREIDFRRCERIGWPRCIIENMDREDVLVWKNQRKGSERTVIALDDFSYVVIIDERDDYVLLWTAYCVEQEHRRRKLQKEYEATKKAL